jgi:AraC-like DNA-binding protein
LTPASIAAAHHVSLRYLHKLFEEYGQVRTVAAWVRERRLDRCRRDLADPLLGDWTVEQVASRWGLRGGAHFSRLFKAAFGMPPTAYRLLATGPGSSA